MYTWEKGLSNLNAHLIGNAGQVGRIIGKGGANVRELQRLTGAIIKFPTTESSSSSSGSTTANSTTNAPAAADPNSQTNVHILGTFYSVQV